MTQIDWSKAGKGFNFYFKGKSSKDVGQFYFVSPLNDRFVSETGSYILFSDMKDIPDLFEIHARPDNCEWSGEGLPPVGAELEAGFACEDFSIWHKGVCVAVGEDPEGREEFCVVKFGNKIAMYRDEGRRMRPIRTPAQLAAEEREKAINAIAEILTHDGTFFQDAERLYDAGLRFEVKS